MLLNVLNKECFEQVSLTSFYWVFISIMYAHIHAYIIYILVYYLYGYLINKSGFPMRSSLFLHIKIKMWLLGSIIFAIPHDFSCIFLNVNLRHSAGQVYCITRSLQGGYLELSKQVLNCLFTTLCLPKVNTQGKTEPLASLASSFKRLLPNH